MARQTVSAATTFSVPATGSQSSSISTSTTDSISPALAGGFLDGVGGVELYALVAATLVMRVSSPRG